MFDDWEKLPAVVTVRPVPEVLSVMSTPSTVRVEVLSVLNSSVSEFAVLLTRF